MFGLAVAVAIFDLVVVAVLAIPEVDPIPWTVFSRV